MVPTEPAFDTQFLILGDGESAKSSEDPVLPGVTAKSIQVNNQKIEKCRIRHCIPNQRRSQKPQPQTSLLTWFAVWVRQTSQRLYLSDKPTRGQPTLACTNIPRPRLAAPSLPAAKSNWITVSVREKFVCFWGGGGSHRIYGPVYTTDLPIHLRRSHFIVNSGSSAVQVPRVYPITHMFCFSLSLVSLVSAETELERSLVPATHKMATCP